MKASKLIEKLREEMRKYGDVDVVVSTDHAHGEPQDVATFTTQEGSAFTSVRRIWISTEDAL